MPDVVFELPVERASSKVKVTGDVHVVVTSQLTSATLLKLRILLILPKL